MAPKAAQKAAQKKAAKQKKILIFLAVPLLAVFYFSVLPMLQGKSSPPEVTGTPAAATTPAGSIPSPSPAAPVTAGITELPVDSFRSFTALHRKDPFSKGESKTTSKSSKPKAKKSGKSGGHDAKSTKPSAPLTGAVISYNGTKLSLTIDSTFGHAPGLSGVPLFRLVSVPSSKSAVVGVVGTQQQFTLLVNHKVTLEQNGGWTYTLLLEPQGSVAPLKVTTP